MNLRTYLRIKQANMVKRSENEDDRRDYERVKKELENNLSGFERTLDNETTYPGYGYELGDLGPYGRMSAPDEYSGPTSGMPHIPHSSLPFAFNDGRLHQSIWSNSTDKLKLGPFGNITEEPSNVYTDKPGSRRYAGWTSTDLGIKNPSFFGRLFGSKTINNPDVNKVADDMKDTLNAMKYFYRKNPEVYERAIRDADFQRRWSKRHSAVPVKEVEDFPF